MGGGEKGGGEERGGKKRLGGGAPRTVKASVF